MPSMIEIAPTSLPVRWIQLPLPSHWVLMSVDSFESIDRSGISELFATVSMTAFGERSN